MRKSSIDAFPLRYDIQGYDMKLMLLRKETWLSHGCEMFRVRRATYGLVGISSCLKRQDCSASDARVSRDVVSDKSLLLDGF
jgi:hypothetical protein